VRNVLIAEVLVFGLGGLAPWLLTRKTESTEQRAARLLRGRVEAQFKTNPENEQLARELIEAYFVAGDRESAEKVRAQHEAAVNAAQEKRLTTQLAALDKDPSDEAALAAVLQTLEEKGQLDRAKERYTKFVELRREPEYRAGYAEWLSYKGFGDEGIAEYRALVKEAPDFEGVHKFLARALVMAGRLDEAQEEYQRELVLDPDDDDAKDAMEELDAELGPLSKAKVTAIQRELKGVRKPPR
jgi:tetratricopeptide (TPR) repeat protein